MLLLENPLYMWGNDLEVMRSEDIKNTKSPQENRKKGDGTSTLEVKTDLQFQIQAVYDDTF